MKFKKSVDILPAVPDNEGQVTRVTDRNDKWFRDPEGNGKHELDYH
jgi:hypothetical protein